VGEFSTDGATGKQSLIVKMLKGNKVNNTHLPTWDLMMKNVYSLGESGIKQETFQMQILYTDPASNNDVNFINEGVNKAARWIELLGADQINIQQDRISDGFYDFIESVTIRAQNGRIYFPVREPFGSYLRSKLADPIVANRYCFDSLYSVTPVQAQTKFPAKNRFKFWVKFETSSSNVISLNATNVPQGSVVVTAGGKTLVENQDYTVNYMMGQVTIINEGILNSSTPVKVSLESNSLFNIQTKNLLGANLNYRVSKDFNIGGTVMNLTEKPLNFKVNLGDEPMSNTVWGLNTKYHSELPLLTKALDRLPLLSTKEKSMIDFSGEFAQLLPGTSSAIQNNESDLGESYIDNFEGAETNTSLTVRTSWFLASTPRGRPTLFPEGDLSNSLAVGFNRANLTWYSIDNLFIDNSTNTPQYLQNDNAQQNNNFIRPINQTEVFPQKQGQNGINPNITTSRFGLLSK
jgi:cell surface protein SprA